MNFIMLINVKMPTIVGILAFISRINTTSGLKVIKLEYILRLKIKRNDWLIADMCLQAANHYALF